MGEKTCGACCWGPSVSREGLARRLRRHRALFPSSGLPGPVGLLRHELLARRGLDLLLAPLLWLPVLGSKLRSWFQGRVVCSFLAFLDDGETAVGCLLHPTRWDGAESRRGAFRLLAGVACGAPDYLCASAVRFSRETPLSRLRFQIATRRLDWFEYSLAASTYGAHGTRKVPACAPKQRLSGVSPCPSSSTKRST